METTAQTNYVLIDYENVQPAEMNLLRAGSFHVMVFLGPNQTKIPREFAIALQPFGDRAKYVPLASSGRNALDFHIAYYMGVLSRQNRGNVLHVISKDTGFDPLVGHLKEQGVFAYRSESIAAMPCLQPASESLIALAVAHLTKMAKAKPSTEKKLLSTLQAKFKDLSEQQVRDLVACLSRQRIVRVEGTKVAYALPSVSSN